MSESVAYITGDFGDSIAERFVNAADACKIAYTIGYKPVCPFVHNYFNWDIEDIEATKAGREMADLLLELSEIVFVCKGAKDENAAQDIEIAEKLGKEINSLDPFFELRDILRQARRK